MTQNFKLSADAVLGGIKIPRGAPIRLDGSSLFYQGQKLQLGLNTSDVHDPTEMPTYLAGIANEEFRHEEMCPPILVEMDEDKFRTFGEDVTLMPVDVETDDDAYPDEVTVTSSLSNYKVQPRRIASFISDTVRSQARYDAGYVSMERCKRAINMNLELKVLGPSGLLTTVANWNSDQRTTLGVNQNWNGGSSSNPISDLRGRINASIVIRNYSFWCNPLVAGYFLDNSATRDYFRATIGDNALNANIKAVFEAGEKQLDFHVPGIGTFHVCGAKYKASLTATPTYIFPNRVVMTVQPPGRPTNGESQASAYNFRRKGPAGNGFNTREVRIEQRGVGGTLIIAEEASVPTMTGNKLGGILDGVVA